MPINTSATGSDINFYLVTVVCVHINYACDKVTDTDTFYVCGEVIHTNFACARSRTYFLFALACGKIADTISACGKVSNIIFVCACMW